MARSGQDQPLQQPEISRGKIRDAASACIPPLCRFRWSSSARGKVYRDAGFQPMILPSPSMCSARFNTEFPANCRATRFQSLPSCRGFLIGTGLALPLDWRWRDQESLRLLIQFAGARPSPPIAYIRWPFSGSARQPPVFSHQPGRVFSRSNDPPCGSESVDAIYIPCRGNIGADGAPLFFRRRAPPSDIMTAFARLAWRS